VFIGSALGLFVAVRVFKRWDFIKTSWLLLFIGLGLFAVAESVYAVLELFAR